MSRDYFAILGLAPGRHDPREIARRFNRRRQALIDRLGNPREHHAVRQELEELHEAYNALRHPEQQVEHVRLAAGDVDETPTQRLCRMIEASLEGGLLRHSRRMRILEEGRRLGFSEFHSHLLIAQVQFGGPIVTTPRTGRPVRVSDTPQRVAARFAAAGVLAVALFLVAIRWLGA